MFQISVESVRTAPNFADSVAETVASGTVLYGDQKPRTFETAILRENDRAGDRGLVRTETTEELNRLYGGNQTEHCYGTAVPTQQKDDATFELAHAIHSYTVEQIAENGVCQCDSARS